ncbi:MAG: hypothetical protein L0312_07870, partial [Acidobacteria bacterium]|nr:hypothetical protein [Acidobacteriota bacterium]
MEERIISGSRLEDDQTFELNLRPRVLKEYIGQQHVKDNLAIAIAATRSTGPPTGSSAPSCRTRGARSGSCTTRRT